MEQISRFWWELYAHFPLQEQQLEKKGAIRSRPILTRVIHYYMALRGLRLADLAPVFDCSPDEVGARLACIEEAGSQQACIDVSKYVRLPHHLRDFSLALSGYEWPSEYPLLKLEERNIFLAQADLLGPQETARLRYCLREYAEHRLVPLSREEEMLYEEVLRHSQILVSPDLKLHEQSSFFLHAISQKGENANWNVKAYLDAWLERIEWELGKSLWLRHDQLLQIAYKFARLGVDLWEIGNRQQQPQRDQLIALSYATRAYSYARRLGNMSYCIEMLLRRARIYQEQQRETFALRDTEQAIILMRPYALLIGWNMFFWDGHIRELAQKAHFTWKDRFNQLAEEANFLCQEQGSYPYVNSEAGRLFHQIQSNPYQLVELDEMYPHLLNLWREQKKESLWVGEQVWSSEHLPFPHAQLSGWQPDAPAFRFDSSSFLSEDDRLLYQMLADDGVAEMFSSPSSGSGSLLELTEQSFVAEMPIPVQGPLSEVQLCELCQAYERALKETCGSQWFEQANFPMLLEEESLASEVILHLMGPGHIRLCVDLFIFGLQHSLPLVRAISALILGELGVTAAVEPLIRALLDCSGRVQAYAAWALGMLGDTRAIEPLIEKFQDERALARLRALEYSSGLEQSRMENQVRLTVVWSLGRLGDPRALDPLLYWLRMYHEQRWRRSSLALTSVEMTRRMLEHDHAVLLFVVEALGRLGDIRAGKPLFALLGEGSFYRDLFGEEIPAEERDLQMEKQIRFAVIQALQCLDCLAVLPMLVHLMERYDETECTLKISWAIHELIEHGERQEGISYLLEELPDLSLASKRKVIAILGDLRVKEAIPLLSALMSEASLQSTIIKAMGDIAHPQALEDLLPLLNGARDDLFEGLVWALGQFDDTRAADQLYALLDRYPRDSLPHWEIIEALARLHDSRAFALLIEQLESNTISQTLASLRALGSLGDERAISYLLREFPQGWQDDPYRWDVTVLLRKRPSGRRFQTAFSALCRFSNLDLWPLLREWMELFLEQEMRPRMLWEPELRHLRERIWRDGLSYLERVRPIEALSTLSRLLYVDLPEIRLRAATVLAGYEGEQVVTIGSTFLCSSSPLDWQASAVLIQALGEREDARALAALKQVLDAGSEARKEPDEERLYWWRVLRERGKQQRLYKELNITGKVIQAIERITKKPFNYTCLYNFSWFVYP